MNQNNIINLSDYREEKQEEELKQLPPIEFPAFEVNGYYTYPVLGVKIHCISITENSHLYNDEPVCIMEDQFGFILNHRVMYKETDDKIAVDFLKSTQELFPKINSVSYDRGFWSKANLEAIKKLVSYVGMSKKGKLSKDDKERQNSESYNIAKKKHSSIESAINALQQHGCD